jgi:trimeric autotransporter adhesin
VRQPSLTFTGDLTPASTAPAQQVAVATNGVARLSISSAGEVTTANEKLNLITVGRGPGAISSNTAVGFQSLLLNTTGNHNTAIGRETLLFNTIGNYNTANGFQALISNDSGSYNTAIGHLTIGALTTGSNNTAIGHQAFLVGNGSSNTCLGYSAGSALTSGSNNTIIGSIAGTAGLADTVIIGAGATERLRIDSSGQRRHRD